MKKLSKYLLWAFGVAWVFQIIAGILYRKGNSMSYSVLLAVSMFAPLFAAVLSGTEIRSIGWKPHKHGTDEKSFPDGFPVCPRVRKHHCQQCTEI